jgi:8-amino-7-oxononanoate synthase
MPTADALRSSLASLEAQHLRRVRRLAEAQTATRLRVDGRELICFCSNDYLGLARHPSVTEAFAQAARQYGLGSGASHLVSGHSRAHHALEEDLARFTGRERAVLFSTGYMANIGAVGALVGRGEFVAEDRLNHASLIDAGLLSGARFARYAHADAADAARVVGEFVGRSGAIVTDGVFSMDGAWLIVDDAHGLGVIGSTGRGSLEHFGLAGAEVPVLVGTLGKAFGSFGAFVAGDADICEWLVQKARSYIYTTALPPAVAAATRVSLALAREESWRRERLREHVARFRAAATDCGLPVLASDTPIQPLLTGSAEKALTASAALAERGLWVGAIRPPTVPRDGSRLRITFSAEHSTAEVDRLCEALAELMRLGVLAP